MLKKKRYFFSSQCLFPLKISYIHSRLFLAFAELAVTANQEDFPSWLLLFLGMHLSTMVKSIHEF